MVKRILLVLENKVYDKAKSIKGRMTWEELFEYLVDKEIEKRKTIQISKEA